LNSLSIKANLSPKRNEDLLFDYEPARISIERTPIAYFDLYSDRRVLAYQISTTIDLKIEGIIGKES
jgi:hypothetical protein